MSLPAWMIKLLALLSIFLLILLCVNQLKIIRGESQLMSVTATGKAESVPDLATVVIGVVSDGVEASAVKDMNNQKANSAINFIKQLGIADKDIQTTGFYLSPKYDYSNNQNKIIGYQANQTITVKVRNINESTAQLQKIIDGAVTNGANELRGVTFSFEDDLTLSDVARKRAIDNAMKKAQNIATDAGLRLGRVVNVMTSSSGDVMPMMNRAVAMVAKSPAANSNIEPGNQEVLETVTVVFKVY